MNKEITLPVSDLKAALPALSRIIGRSKTLPVLQSVRITREKDGQVRLHATDLDAFVTFNMTDMQPGPVTELLVPLEELTKAVKGTSAKDSITLIPEGKDKARIKRPIAGSTMERTISVLPAEEWPEAPKVTQPGVALDPEFGKALKEALALSSDDSSRYILNGACLDVRDKKFHYIVGTNGRALYSANSFCFTLQKSVIIPDSKFLAATDLMDEQPCLLSVEPGKEHQPAEGGQPAQEATAGWIRLESPRWTFITREIEGEFPNWKQVVPVPSNKWTRVFLSDEAVKEMIQVIPNLPGGQSPNLPVRISVDRHGVMLSGRNRDDEAWTSVLVKAVNVEGKSVETCLNRTYFMQALRFGLNQMEIDDAFTPVLVSNAGRKMVIMPVRLEGDKSSAAPAEQTPEPAESSEQDGQQNPPPPATEAQPEERTEMPRQAATVEKEENTSAEQSFQPASAFDQLQGQIESIKDTLKNVVSQLNDALKSIGQAYKEKRATEKEIESIRESLQEIQKIRI